MKHLFKYAFLLLALIASTAAYAGGDLRSFGNEYIAVSGGKPGENCVITALFEPTVVTLGNGEQFTLHQGEQRLLSTDAQATALFISANEPIHVTQTVAFGTSLVTSELPSLSCQTPTEASYTFPQKTVHPQLLLMMPADQTKGFQLDGKVLRLRDANAVTGKADWVYATIDLGTRKAGSTLRLSAPSENYLAAVIGPAYHYFATCDIEASVRIDTIYGSVSHHYIRSTESTSDAERLPDETGGAASAEWGASADPSTLNPQPSTIDSLSHHRASIYMQAAFAGMPVGLSDTRVGLGYGTGAGVLYEFQHKSFMLQTGAGFFWFDHRNDITGLSVPERYDRTLFGGMELPITVGQNFDWFYYQAGFKMGFNIMGKTTSVCMPVNSLSGTTSLVMPPVTKETPMGHPGLVLDPRLSAELGVNLPVGRITRFRIAALFDWGFYPQYMAFYTGDSSESMPSAPLSPLTVGDPLDYATYDMAHILPRASSMGEKFLSHFQVGLKVSLVIGSFGK